MVKFCVVLMCLVLWVECEFMKVVIVGIGLRVGYVLLIFKEVMFEIEFVGYVDL